MRRFRFGLPWQTPLIGIALVVALLGPARAEDPDGSWHFRLTPYLWMSGLDGTMGASERLPTVSVDASFGDVLRHLDAGMMLIGEARHGRLVLLGDASYIKASSDTITSGPLLGPSKVHARTISSTLLAGYRFYDQEGTSLDGLAGARIFSVRNTIDFDGGLLRPVSATSEDTWADPVIAARVQTSVTPTLSFVGYADVGGLGVSSDRTWQVYAGLNYRLTESISASAGYRYLDVYHENGGFLFDASQQGPLIGLGFSF